MKDFIPKALVDIEVIPFVATINDPFFVHIQINRLT
jgi:hypothetical protein